MLRDSDTIVDHLNKKLGIGFNETTADGKFTLKEGEWVCNYARDIATGHGGGGNRKVLPTCSVLSALLAVAETGELDVEEPIAQALGFLCDRRLDHAGGILPRDPAGLDGILFAPLLHAEWHGFTPTDWVFPTFLFVVGNALAFIFPLAGRLSDAMPASTMIIGGLVLFAVGFAWMTTADIDTTTPAGDSYGIVVQGGLVGAQCSVAGIIVQGGLYNAVIRALQMLGLADPFGVSRVPIYCMNVTYPMVPEELLGFCAGKRQVQVSAADFQESKNVDSVGDELLPNTAFAGGPITVGSVDYTADDYGWVFLSTAVRRNLIPGP